jgi:two-component system KDP operon response regulator KdpE
MSTVLLVEDDLSLRWTLLANLTAEALDVVEAGSGEEALRVAAEARPDLMLLDLGLPGIGGLETLRRLRAVSSMPVVVLTVQDSLHDKVTALNAGADDYVVKPFEPDELVARVRANLRRVEVVGPQVVRVGDLEVDLGRRLVTYAGEHVTLTALEVRVLEMLVERPGRLLTHAELLDGAWGTRPEGGEERVRVTIAHLRRKLRDDAGRPRAILTELGLGYRWVADQEIDDDDRADDDAGVRNRTRSRTQPSAN